MNGLIEGKKYVLSTPVDTVITDVKYNIPLGTVKAGQQYVFQAVSDAVTVADGCTIRPFEGSNGASVGVVGGSEGSGDKGSDYLNYTFNEDGTFAIDGKMENLKDAKYMFASTYAKTFGEMKKDFPTVNNNLVSFAVDTPSLSNCGFMFAGCTKMRHWRGSFDKNSIPICAGMFGTWPGNCTQLDIDSFIYLLSILPQGNGGNVSVGVAKDFNEWETKYPEKSAEAAVALEGFMEKNWIIDLVISQAED